jgi:putative nucleotidyltransferase with HDIG domain
LESGGPKNRDDRMPDNLKKNSTTSQQVELAINQLDSLSTLDCIAAQYLPKLLQSQFQPSALIDIIESDPALTLRILSLISSSGSSLPDGRFSLSKALQKLPAHQVRNAILSIRINQTVSTDDSPNSYNISLKKGLYIHSLAVACCAKEIAELATPQMDQQLAYCAGLLHDIGKLAMDQTMPRSFARICEEAKSTEQCTQTVEQKHLGTDHTIIGKHLAQKWQLPNLIILAIWLHHSRTLTISRDMPEARIAAVIQLADLVARQTGIGQSGSYDKPQGTAPIAWSLAISTEQLQHIRENLSTKVEQKTKILGMDLPNAHTKYCEAVHDAAVQFAQRDTDLSNENRQLLSASSHLDFMKELLLNINLTSTALDLAEHLAVRWQKFYQTGRVCLILVPPTGSESLEAVTVESLAQSQVVSIKIPDEISVIPKTLLNNFAIVNAHDHIDWLFEQLETSFDVNQTKLVPLLCGGKAIGVIAFELHYPSDTELFEESIRTFASIGGTVLGMAINQQREQQYAERFAGLICTHTEEDLSPEPKDFAKRPGQTTPVEVSMNALAEMAAGAAHELNNPLAVISGRVQLLAEAEKNQEKKQILDQIHENANKASEIIEDLMSFAEPPRPKPGRINITQILDEAIQLANRKTNIEELNTQIEIADGTGNVFVDSAQIVSAIANVITNAIESYSGRPGAIRITGDIDTTGEMVKLSIADSGCGMDTQTLEKAMQPFFSARPAGRKRGMGLAYAARLIHLNNGSMNIESEPGIGTTVNIYLPYQ